MNFRIEREDVGCSRCELGPDRASGPAWRMPMLLPRIGATGPRATRENKEDITDAQDEIECYSWNVTKVDSGSHLTYLSAELIQMQRIIPRRMYGRHT